MYPIPILYECLLDKFKKKKQQKTTVLFYKLNQLAN